MYFIVGSGNVIEGGNTGVKKMSALAFVDVVHAQPSIHLVQSGCPITLRVLQLPRIAANLEHVRMDYREQVRKGPIRFDDRLCVVVVLCCRTVG